MKRLFDIFVATLALLLLMPLMAMIALVVLLVDHAPVFFLQERVCRDGQVFLMWKFRTMRNEPGILITTKTDHRKTPLGTWLRRYRLDEIPQFFHILSGKMSLVGPRPEVPQYIDHDDPHQAQVLSVRPGLVDPAVLANLDEEDKLGGVADAEQYYCQKIRPEKLQRSAAYLDSATFMTDLRLLFVSAWRILGNGKKS